ncbi:DNA-binding transcriptional regulator YhcF (GntR family) [Ruminiclostridium sufflavum DSM 19573]|uniref:DNA-binding transcriptional regulator YhcF (GntR family) n=1 Tax=Ruminiclostridium sufflavum DSM 19573 TaxID=1121337 RepID=A0A318XMU1_9FIRM|nr:GntR family transcriptional regulator [Ruminiclostridium sufflavum]PYG87247.1 DNA-binding transcriptional regulator YhcF (GntR family) [Ruminiclostridium sufflavum DSM 19573]
MKIDFNADKPIYIQLAEEIEDAVLSGAYEEEAQIPSTTEISVSYKINPATALKGINLLVDSGIVYKKRGLGMFVSSNAKEKISDKRRVAFFDAYITSLVSEAKKLSITKEDIIKMLERGFDK